jgi:predicted regulator of Ras-like GTPase activity (Roadblock/LC7/MglB family)
VKELDWLLGSLASEARGVRCAVILSPDGLALSRSPGVTEAVAEHLAALAAALHGLARGAGQQFGQGEVSQTIVEMQAALLFVTPAARGTCVAVLAEATADAGQIAYEMAVLVKRVGHHMTVDPRFPLQDPVAW